VQPLFDAVGFDTQPVGAPVADRVAAVEDPDLTLDQVDTRLERPDLAEIVVAIVTVRLV
jgi:hypothetical protein